MKKIKKNLNTMEVIVSIILLVASVSVLIYTLTGGNTYISIYISIIVIIGSITLITKFFWKKK